jgi:ABC-type bacteriocin/lantibiotic exporter with double-glycine peptidase domain
LKNVSFKYIDESFFGLEEISFKVEPGMSIAIVGSSGAGKSTLLDIVLGVLEPTNGVVKISGVSPKEAFCLWPGQTAYIPQDIYLANLTIRENIAFGVPSDSIDESRLSYAIENSYLNEFINGLPLGVDSVVGENGTLISGGQKQRLGIARALYTLPNLLVLDEATSALDSETEAIITQSLKNLKGKVTTITVAHRLSTVRDADNLIYLRNGRIAAIGTFNEVREMVPEFGLQAGLMGL